MTTPSTPNWIAGAKSGARARSAMCARCSSCRRSPKRRGSKSRTTRSARIDELVGEPEKQAARLRELHENEQLREALRLQLRDEKVLATFSLPWLKSKRSTGT